MLLFRCVFRDAPARMCISGCSCLDICLEMLLLEGSHGVMHKEICRDSNAHFGMLFAWMCVSGSPAWTCVSRCSCSEAPIGSCTKYRAPRVRGEPLIYPLMPTDAPPTSPCSMRGRLGRYLFSRP
ncbi:hypothetical protein BHM03_00053549 [Ensete ventricosum]|nr:hypothetical protein BHM03_00053549 [Ensete ventricosum]